MYLDSLMQELGRFNRDDSFIAQQLSKSLGVAITYGVGLGSVYSDTEGLKQLLDYNSMLYTTNYNDTTIIFFSCIRSDDISVKSKDYFGIPKSCSEYLLKSGVMLVLFDAQGYFKVCYKDLAVLVSVSSPNIDSKFRTVIDFLISNYQDAVDCEPIWGSNIDLEGSLSSGKFLITTDSYDLNSDWKEKVESDSTLFHKLLGYLSSVYSAHRIIDYDINIQLNTNYFPLVDSLIDSFDPDTNIIGFTYKPFNTDIAVNEKHINSLKYFPQLLFISWLFNNSSLDSESYIRDFCRASKSYASTRAYGKTLKMPAGFYVPRITNKKTSLEMSASACKVLGLNPFEFRYILE